MRKCAQVIKLLRWVGQKVCELHTYEGFHNLDAFLREFEIEVPEKQRLLALDVTLKDTLTWLWLIHKPSIEFWL